MLLQLESTCLGSRLAFCTPTEIAIPYLRQSGSLPAVEPGALNPETALDELETDVLRVGQQLMRQLLQAEWAEVDERLTAEYQARFSPSDGDAGRE